LQILVAVLMLLIPLSGSGSKAGTHLAFFGWLRCLDVFCVWSSQLKTIKGLNCARNLAANQIRSVLTKDICFFCGYEFKDVVFLLHPLVSSSSTMTYWKTSCIRHVSKKWRM
jgi:hypothetical protein